MMEEMDRFQVPSAVQEEAEMQAEMQPLVSQGFQAVIWLNSDVLVSASCVLSCIVVCVCQ